MGKFELRPQYKHDQKPSDVTLNDGTVVKSIQGTETDAVVNTQVIRLKYARG